jgi:hypothetical protein
MKWKNCAGTAMLVVVIEKHCVLHEAQFPKFLSQEKKARLSDSTN